MRRGPFRSVTPALALAGAWGVGGLAWALVGVLPGGRWTAVHVFTLGVLTNAVVGFARHMAASTLHQPSTSVPGRLALLNAGAVSSVVGVVAGNRWLAGAGGLGVAVAVVWLWRDLRGIRFAAGDDTEWGPVVRAYEHACGLFVLGVGVGALLAVGAIPPEWYLGLRGAHLRVLILGWGVLPLLGSALLLGPTLLRRRMSPESLAVGRVWLPRVAAAIVAAAPLVAAAGAGWAVGRIGAGLLLVTVAAAAGRTVWPVLSVAAQRLPPANGLLLVAALVWLPAAIGLDAVVVTARWGRGEAAAGAVLLFGVLAQAIVAVGAHALASGRLLRSADGAAGVAAAVVANGGVLLLALGAAGLGPAAPVGWVLLVAGSLAAVRPPRRPARRA